MSLATRCTQCGTVFRVVQDQLKVSEGWVRCGRCDEVFNALEGLFDLERDSPPPTPVSAAAALVSTREDWRPSGNGALSQPELPTPLSRSGPSSRPGELRQFDRPQSHATRPSQFAPHSGYDSPMFEPVDRVDSAPVPFIASSPSPLPEPARPSRRALSSDSGPETIIGEPLSGLDYSEARLTSELLVDPDIPLGVYPPGTAEAEALAIAQQTRPAPAFVRRAEEAQRWQSPLMKATMTMLALLLFVGLGAQALYHNRNAWAAKWPAIEPTLSQWCTALGCTIEAPQNIADVHIESSALTPAATPASAPESSSAVKLSVVLRNHGETRVALPSLDVTLTDSAGQVMSRKALSPADFGIKEAVLQTGAESTLQVVLTTGTKKAAGYTVDVFYP